MECAPFDARKEGLLQRVAARTRRWIDPLEATCSSVGPSSQYRAVVTAGRAINSNSARLGATIFNGTSAIVRFHLGKFVHHFIAGDVTGSENIASKQGQR